MDKAINNKVEGKWINSSYEFKCNLSEIFFLGIWVYLPDRFCSKYCFLVTAWVVLGQARCTWVEIGLMIISVVLFEKYCDVRNSEAVMVLLILGVVYLKSKNKPILFTAVP